MALSGYQQSCNGRRGVLMMSYPPLIIINIKSMCERKAWTKQEDAALTEIMQVKKIKKWNDVSKAMDSEYNISGRTGKQCRQRWHNQLDPLIKNSQWTWQEQRTLFDAHNKHGNRWATISKALEGRTDNCVKNHFYSTLRRAFRRLNRYAADNKHKPGIKQLKPVLLTKLVAAAEDKFDGKLKLSPEIIEVSVNLKNRLLPLARECDNVKQDEDEIQSLIQQIPAFCKSYKRKKAKKGKKNEDRFVEEDSNSVCSQEEVKEQTHPTLPTERKVEKGNNQYVNLFTFNPGQIINQSPQMFEIASQNSLANQYQQVPRSATMNQQDPQLEIMRRESGASNWSIGFYRIPSLHERISGLSNHFNLDIFGFDNICGHRNMFGVDFHIE